MKKEAETVWNGLVMVPDVRVEYKGFIIQPKLDMGATPWRIGPNDIRKGYVITKDGANVMPGATWALSVSKGKDMIDAFLSSGGDAQNFYQILQEREGRDEWEKV